jgi:hypothetical protein
MYKGNSEGCTVDRLADGRLHVICNYYGDDLRAIESETRPTDADKLKRVGATATGVPTMVTVVAEPAEI